MFVHPLLLAETVFIDLFGHLSISIVILSLSSTATIGQFTNNYRLTDENSTCNFFLQLSKIITKDNAQPSGSKNCLYTLINDPICVYIKAVQFLSLILKVNSCKIYHRCYGQVLT